MKKIKFIFHKNLHEVRPGTSLAWEIISQHFLARLQSPDHFKQTELVPPCASSSSRSIGLAQVSHTWHLPSTNAPRPSPYHKPASPLSPLFTALFSSQTFHILWLFHLFITFFSLVCIQKQNASFMKVGDLFLFILLFFKQRLLFQTINTYLC